MEIETVLTEFRRLAASAVPSKLTDPTPCSQWAVRDLINHVVGGGHLFGGALRGDAPPMDPDAGVPDLLGDDPIAALDRSLADFRSGMSSPGVEDRMVTLPFGTMPSAAVLQLAAVDVLVHTWDLARAIGEEVRLPAGVAEEAEQLAQAMIPAIRGEGTFDEATEAPAGAPAIDRLAAFAGRTVPA